MEAQEFGDAKKRTGGFRGKSLKSNMRNLKPGAGENSGTLTRRVTIGPK